MNRALAIRVSTAVMLGCLAMPAIAQSSPFGTMIALADAKRLFIIGLPA